MHFKNWCVSALFGVIALGSQFVAAPIEGQVRLIPQIGVYSAVDEPGSVQGLNGAYEIGKYESTTAYGAALEFGAGQGVSFRVGGLYAPEAENVVSGVGCQTGCPAGVDLLSVNAALVVRPLGRIFLLEPYLVAGGGLKRFNYEPEDLGDGIGQIFSDESKGAGLLGVGASLSLGAAVLTVELADHFHWADKGIDGLDRTRMDDFFFTLGVVLGGY